MHTYLRSPGGDVRNPGMWTYECERAPSALNRSKQLCMIPCRLFCSFVGSGFLVPARSMERFTRTVTIPFDKIVLLIVDPAGTTVVSPRGATGLRALREVIPRDRIATRSLQRWVSKKMYLTAAYRDFFNLQKKKPMGALCALDVRFFL